MPGIAGCFDQPRSFQTIETVTRSIDLLQCCETTVLQTAEGFVALASHKKNPLLESYCYEDARYMLCCAGDLVGARRVPWQDIIEAMEHKRYRHFSAYRGTFVFFIADKINKKVFIIGDRFALHPVYYRIKKNGLLFSSSIVTYCRVDEMPEFNIRWMYEFLYFNYPLGQTSLIKDVQRMPPAAMLEYDLQSKKFSITRYAERLAKPERLLTGGEAFEKAYSVFSETVPLYFQSSDTVACSLTVGLDSRTVLAFAPAASRESMATYTYGLKDCSDMKAASHISASQPFPHIEIAFNHEFLEGLPALISHALYLSQGLERVSRATLDYVYRKLTDSAQRFPVIITGVSGDHLFRDHLMGSGNVPAIISADMMQSLQKGSPVFNSAWYKKAFSESYGYFAEHIQGAFLHLQDEYGSLCEPEMYLSYLVYEVAPKHFGGEAAIVNNYATFRTPYWDQDIIKLAYDIEYGTLGFSESLSGKDTYREKVLQASIMERTKYFTDAYIEGLPIALFSANNKFWYRLNHIVKRGPRKITSLLANSPHIYTEDWPTWFRTVLRGQIGALLTRSSLISGYVDHQFLDAVKEKTIASTKDIHWLNKVLTIELILNLIKRKWSL